MEAREIRVMYYPKDFSGVEHFYRSILEWPIRNEFNEDGYRVVMFEPGKNIVVELLTREDEKDEDFRFKVSIEIDDVSAFWSKHNESLVVAHPLRSNSWGDTSCSFVDPEGNHLTFFTRH